MRSSSTTTRDADADITYQFRFQTHVKNHKTFLYNTGPIGALDSASWNRTQTYTITRLDEHGHAKVIGSNLTCPPVNIGPRSTPDYGALAQAAVHNLSGGIKVFAGQRREGFFVDLGSIFDLGDLRPFQQLHLIPTASAAGVDATKDLNVHTIAMQIPMTQPDQGRLEADRPDGSPCGHRRLYVRPSPQGPHPLRQR